MKVKPKLHLLLIILVAAILGALIYFSFRYRNPETVQPTWGEIVESIYALGKVKSSRQYEVKVAILSTVQKVFVREGENVKQGDPLIKFSDTAVFKAPFDGVVTALPINEGEPTTPNAPLLRLEDLNHKYIEVSLEQQAALRATKGQKAEVSFESVRGEKLQGEVTALFSKNDEFLGHIEVKGLKANVLPGMTADVAIIVGKNQNALLIPAKAIHNGSVIVLRDGKRKKVQLTIGNIDGQMAEVIEGDIKESDLILIERKN